MLRITALMDNKPSEQKALINEHGLSLLVEGDHYRFLFDCGAGEHPLTNAHTLGRSLQKLDAVVLSHSHYDHAGGYKDLIERGLGSTELWTGPHFFEPKFASDGVRYTDLSAGFDPCFLETHGIRRHVVDGMEEVFSGVWLIGRFERRNSFETIPKRFVRLTESGFIEDDFEDEICVALDVGGTLAVLVGCSHPGILNMIETVHKRLQKPVTAVFGGTHLVEADEARIRETLKRLKQMGLRQFGLSHCTGDEAECLIHQDTEIESCHLSVGGCAFFSK